jgi:hypothetical protein
MSHPSKLIKACLVLAIAAGGFAAVDVAHAGGWTGAGGRGGGWSGGGGWNGGGSHGGGWHHGGGHAHVGVFIGGPLWWPGYYGYPYGYGGYGYPYAYPYPYGYGYAYPYPYPYAGAYPPAAQAAPPVTQETPQAAPLWYYCPDSRMFYPHVSECPSGWQAVPATPPDVKH